MNKTINTSGQDGVEPPLAHPPDFPPLTGAGSGPGKTSLWLGMSSDSGLMGPASSMSSTTVLSGLMSGTGSGIGSGSGSAGGGGGGGSGVMFS